MSAPTRQITFQSGRGLAAYLRLEGPRARAQRTEEAAPNLLVDYDEAGRPLGVEIVAFDAETVGRINDVLASIGHAALRDEELAPLGAA